MKRPSAFVTHIMLALLAYTFMVSNGCFVFCIEGNGEISVESNHVASEFVPQTAIPVNQETVLSTPVRIESTNHFNLSLSRNSRLTARDTARLHREAVPSGHTLAAVKQLPSFTEFPLPSIQALQKHSTTVLII